MIKVFRIFLWLSLSLYIYIHIWFYKILIFRFFCLNYLVVIHREVGANYGCGCTVSTIDYCWNRHLMKSQTNEILTKIMFIHTLFTKKISININFNFATIFSIYCNVMFFITVKWLILVKLSTSFTGTVKFNWILSKSKTTRLSFSK